jgi:DNA-binding transcriptional regulator YdaS (Cro superfamily)
MRTEIPPKDRRKFAESAELNEQYLYQCLTGRRDMSPAAAMKLELATRGAVRRWDVCQASWFQLWPELVKAKGAPPVPAKPTPEPTQAGG